MYCVNVLDVIYYILHVIYYNVQKNTYIYIVKPALHEHTKAPNHLDTNFRIPPHRSSGHRQFGREYFCKLPTSGATLKTLCG